MSDVTLATAGSLAPALSEFADAFTSKTGLAVQIHRGPAGLLTRAITAGLPAEVFVSASRTGPDTLHRVGLFGEPRQIAANRLVLVARPGLQGAPGDPIALLGDARLRVGMSTPGADPSGDYAAAFLGRLSATDPARWQDLGARTASLFGAALPDPAEPARSPALDALLGGRADLVIVYATSARRIAADLPGARILPLPAPLSPPTEVCVCLRLDAPVPARLFHDALQGPDCAAVLRGYGFVTP